MKIILPHKRISVRVRNFKQIKTEVQGLIKLIDEKNFGGKWKEAFAISHCQVSESPYNFFCLDKNFTKEFGGNRTICNARIMETDEETVPFKEACMSYPHRGLKNTRRYYKITIACEVLRSGPTKILGYLRTITLKLEGISAFIAQHEIDHTKGVDIFTKFK